MIYHDISAISSWRKMLDDQLSKSDAGKSSISMELTNIFDFSTCRKILRMQILKKILALDEILLKYDRLESQEEG